ncbi:MAG TPA: LysM peptidoglycan-binding domain-containing protein [Tepidimicrobium sp.]|nr:LysM peptidoglycan-binding domain-containing protein [Tepidimicrobium sp.]
MNQDYNIKQRCPAGSFAHTIRYGDTLYLLANRYNTTVEAIMAINPGIDPHRLRIGQVICIPSAMPPTRPPCSNGFYYTIKAGDTFYKLGQQFGVSVDAIMRANPGVDPNRLQIGQVICIPTHTTPTPPCHNGFHYQVRAGDTFYILSQRYNVSVDAIMRANPGVDPNRLQIGQIICIPVH